jgi:hypothetical protein
MIYVIKGSAVSPAPTNWIVNALAFVAGSLLAAASAGALLGELGAATIDGSQQLAIRVIAAAATAVTLLDLVGRRPRLLQWNRETSRVILDRYGAILGAARNGLELGVGATTRIGFWLWYAVPLGAFVAASPTLGALIYASYGGARSLAPVVRAVFEDRAKRSEIGQELKLRRPQRTIAGHLPAIEKLAAALLLALGIALSVAQL